MGGLDINKVGLRGYVVRPMVRAQPAIPPPPPELPPRGGGDDDVPRIYPKIQINLRQMRDTVADSRRALHLANQPPTLFTRARKLVRVVAKHEDPPEIEMLGVDSVHGHLARIANWFVISKDDEQRECHPHKDIARDLLVNPPDDLPELETVASTPVFDRDGGLLTAPGYHQRARVWLHPDPTLKMERVPEKPTRDQVNGAVRLLLNDLLADFSFVTDADRAHALIAIVLPFVRRMIRGFTPLHLIEAPGPGSGKGLLSDIVSILATGYNAEPTTVPGNEDETRKKMASILLKAPAVILLDNIRTGIDSSTIASILTADPWQDRRLGSTEIISLPNKSVWIATGNNPKLSMEIARRCVRIRIDPKRAQPWKRPAEDFRHPMLREWVHEERSKLVHAVLVIVRSWISAGAKKGKESLGSFESWARVMSGILEHAGVEGFLANSNELYDVADTESGEWIAFCTAWWRKFGSAAKRSSELAALAREENLLGSVVRDDKERAQVTRLGNLLKAKRDLIVSAWRINATTNAHTKSMEYSLTLLEGAEVPALAADGGHVEEEAGRVRGQRDLDFTEDPDDEGGA